MTDFQFSVLSVAIVCVLAVLLWRLDERREKRRATRRLSKVLEMRPYFSEEEKGRWIL